MPYPRACLPACLGAVCPASQHPTTHAACALLAARCRRAIKRAHARMSHAELDAMGVVQDEEAGGRDEEAVGVHVHHSYPASLEREGFVGSNSAYNLPSSPEFELKAVAGGQGSGGSSGGAAAAAARDKGRLPPSGSGGVSAGSGSVPALLAVTAASGSGTLQASLGSLGLGSARSGGTKAKVSPQHSSTSSLLANGGDDGELGRGEAKATRRHTSIGSEHMV